MLHLNVVSTSSGVTVSVFYLRRVLYKKLRANNLLSTFYSTSMCCSSGYPKFTGASKELLNSYLLLH